MRRKKFFGKTTKIQKKNNIKINVKIFMKMKLY